MSFSELISQREFWEFLGAIGTLFTLYVAKLQREQKKETQEIKEQVDGGAQIHETLELLIDTFEKRLEIMERSPSARTRSEDREEDR